MKQILIIGTGGTIASVPSDRGLTPAMTPAELLDYIPEAYDLCQIHFYPLYNIDSTNLQPEYWIKITRMIKESYHDYDGFIITHGTDTMAYTAAALSYLIQNAEKPIVITGSQKPMGSADTDARKNLLDSLRFAIKPDVSGVYVVFGGSAILGTRARKVRSKSCNAFESINYPAAAFFDGSRILCYQRPRPAVQPISFYEQLDPKVFLLKLIPGIEPEILRYIGDHYDAIVIESYGVGGIPFQDKRNFLRELEQLSGRGKIVVLATQVMLEGSDAERYEVGYRAVSRMQVLQAYDMTVEAAVVKLMWILGHTKDFQTVRSEFYRNIGEDILAFSDETV